MSPSLMNSLHIIEAINILKYGSRTLILSFRNGQVDQLLFRRGKEAFGSRIVTRHSYARLTLAHSILTQKILYRIRYVLAASVAVKDAVFNYFMSRQHRQYCIHHQLFFHPICHIIPKHFTCHQIPNQTLIHRPLARLQILDIARQTSS